MLVSPRAVRLLFESCAAQGISPAELTEPLGLDHAQLTRGARVEWTTLNAILDQLTRRVGGDDDRLRAIGRGTIEAPASELVRSFAATVVSPYALYDLAVN